MKSIYKKSELTFSIILIAVYCVMMSAGDGLSARLGVANSVTLPVAAALCLVLAVFIKTNGLFKKYGFCKPVIKSKKTLYYIPLAVLLTVNLWHGISLEANATEVALHIVTMLLVGFLEETIFRGFLFKALLEQGTKSAIIISSVTFGAGHIIRLFNGSGAELFENILQVIYAMAAGFMFVMLFFKTKSLIPCILGHGCFNALSIFQNESALTMGHNIFSCLMLVIISLGYALYLTFAIKDETKQRENFNVKE